MFRPRIRCRIICCAAIALAAPQSLAAAQPTEVDLMEGRFALGAIDRRSLAQPARNTVYSCNRQTMGESLDRPWVDDKGVIDLTKKPVVAGAISWQSLLKVDKQPARNRLDSNGLPHHPTGIFPVEQSSAAYRFDRNPNTIQAYGVQYALPSDPRIAPTPGCLPMGTIGVALSGAVFFNALDAPGRDAVANEIFDRCEGHPERNGRYHYHHFSPCFEQGNPKAHSPLIGYALDGFAIYGPRDEGGNYISNDKLDECHGHVGPTPSSDGGTQTVYHYHANREFPYTLGCFRGGAVAQPSRRPAGRSRAAARPDPTIDESRAPTRQVATVEPAAPAHEAAAVPASANDLSVIMLGTGGPPANPERAGPSALVRHGNALLLVDMGRDVQTRLQQANIGLRNLTALLFTHHHLDHNEEFVPILLKARLRGGARDIVGPPGTRRYADFVFEFYKEDSDYRAQRTGGSGAVMRDVRVREVSGGEFFTLAGLTVKTARVNHTIHTVAYRFDGDGKSIVISGDLSFSPGLIELARDADLLLIDAGQVARATARGPGLARRQLRSDNSEAMPPARAHSTIMEVAEMARQANVKRLVLTHITNPNIDEKTSRALIAEIFKGEIIFARDLLEITP